MLLFENVAEVFITVVLFINGFVNTVSIVFFVPTALNTTVRLIMFFFQVLRNYFEVCRTFFDKADDARENHLPLHAPSQLPNIHRPPRY